MAKQTYVFLRDYPLGNKKKGDKIQLESVPKHLKEYFKETATGKKDKPKYKGDIPTDKDTKDTIIKFLHANGVMDTDGLTKDDLIMMVEPFYNEDEQ